MADYNETITVTILDTQTGLTGTNNQFSAYWWAEHNGNCDCNRSLMIDDDEDISPCGNKRYLIVASDSTSYTLTELNEDYPQELVEKYIGR